MVIVDSSVLIPLLRVGRIELLFACFNDVIVPEAVWEEVVIVGKELGKVFAAIEENAWRFKITKSGNEKLPEIKGLQINDLKVLAAAKVQNEVLLTNDAAVYEAAVAQSVKALWLTGLVLYAVRIKKLSPAEGKTAVLELVKAGAYIKSETLVQVLLLIDNIKKS